MNDEDDKKPEKKPTRRAIIGHSGRYGAGIAAALMLSGMGKSLTQGPDLSKDPRFAQPDKYFDNLIKAQDADFPLPTHRKGGLKKHIQATRPRWRQPR